MASNTNTTCVNDLLYYVNFRRKISSVNDVVATCETFYTADAVFQAKRMFFDVVGERDGMRFVNRRGKSGENPTKFNLEDLVNAMNKCDNDGISLPSFYSCDYANVPHCNDGNVSMNQLLHLIYGMKQQIVGLEKKVSVVCPAIDSAGFSVNSADSSAINRASANTSAGGVDFVFVVYVNDADSLHGLRSLYVR